MADTKVRSVPAEALPNSAREVGRPARAHVLLVDDQPARLLAYEAMLTGLEDLALETDRLPIVRGKPRGARIVGYALP